MKIGIVGSRSRNTEKDCKILYEFLEKVLSEYKNETFEFVSGGCSKGADRFAELIADDLNIPIKIFYPNKSNLPTNPTRIDFARINYVRNTLIAKYSDILIALVTEDRTGGTEHTIKEYIKYKKRPPILL